MQYAELVSQLKSMDIVAPSSESEEADLIEYLSHDMPLIQNPEKFDALLPADGGASLPLSSRFASGLAYCCSRDLDAAIPALVAACHRVFVVFPVQVVDGVGRDRLIQLPDLFVAALDDAEAPQEDVAENAGEEVCLDDDADYESYESSVDLGQLFVKEVEKPPVPWDFLLEEFLAYLPLSHVARHSLDPPTLRRLLMWSRGRPCHGLVLELIIRRCLLVSAALPALHGICADNDDEWFSVLASCCADAADNTAVYCRRCLVDRGLALIAAALDKAKQSTGLALTALHRCYPALKFFSLHARDPQALLTSRVMQSLAVLLGRVGAGVREELAWVAFRLCCSHEALAHYMLQHSECAALLEQQVDLILSERRHGIAGAYRCVKAMLLCGAVPEGCRQLLLLGKQRVMDAKSEEWQREGAEQKYLKRLKTLLSNKQE